MSAARRCAFVVGLATLAGCNPPATKAGITSDPPTQAAPRDAASAQAPTPREHPRLRVVEATNDTDALSLIRTRRLEAKAEGRILVVYVGATWCAPCQRFKAELGSGRLDERLSKLTLLAFDVDRDGDRLAAAGYRSAFVPFVGLPGADGSPAETQQAVGKGGDAWRELLGKLDAWQLAP